MKWNFLYQITAAYRTPDQGATAPRSPFTLPSVVNWICWNPSPPREQNSWVRHWPYSWHTSLAVFVCNPTRSLETYRVTLFFELWPDEETKVSWNQANNISPPNAHNYLCVFTNTGDPGSTVVNRLTPNDPYMGCTAPLTSKLCILYIYSTNVGTEYFKHALYSPFFSLQNAVCFMMLTCLVPVLFTFYIQSVLKLKKIIPAPKG